MPKPLRKSSPQRKTPTDNDPVEEGFSEVLERLQSHLRYASRSGRYLITISYIDRTGPTDRVKTKWFTHKFPPGDFTTVLDHLEVELAKERDRLR